MKKILMILISMASFAPVLAQGNDAMLIFRMDGRSHAISTQDIDSIGFGRKADINDSLFVWQDTVVVRKDIYHCVTTADNWYVNIENPVAADYLNEVDYSNDIDAYQTTYIDEYANRSTDYRKDQPRGVQVSWDAAYAGQYIILSRDKDFSSIDETISVPADATTACLFNMLPGEKYYYAVKVGDNIIKRGHFYTTGQVRMIYLESMRNMRDLGGWPTVDGHRLRYGRLYRGGEMNNSYSITYPNDHTISKEDAKYMIDVMNIRLDMDLRDDRDMLLNDSDPTNNMNHTELEGVEYRNEMVDYNPGTFERSGYYFNQRWGRSLKYIIATLKSGGNVYFHCTWGADRTGILAFLIEGLCGVPEDILSKDYELTCFNVSGRHRQQSYFVYDVNYIKTLRGNTLADKIATYFLNAGVTQQEIDDLRAIMIEK